MESFLSGEERAFDDLYRALTPALMACVRTYVRDDGVAEDLLQQTFLQIYRCRGRFLRGSSLRPWAVTIARRLAIDVLRREQLEARHRDHGDLVCTTRADEILEARQLCAHVESGLVNLPPLLREAFEVVRTQGLSLPEAARKLGISVNAVKVRAHRAHRALLRHLERARSVEARRLAA